MARLVCFGKRSGGLGDGGSGGGELQREGGAMAESLAVNAQGASEFFGGFGAAVQAKSMPGFAGRKSLGKDPAKIFRGDADAIIGDVDMDLVGGGR